MCEHVSYCSVFCFIFIHCFLVSLVKGQDPSTDGPASEIKYAIIGAGIGLFFSICFLLLKIYIIRKQVHDNEPSDVSIRRASERVTDVESRRD